MTDLQFRLLLAAFVALVLAQVFYSAPRDEKFGGQNKEQKFGWLRKLSRVQLYLFLAASVSVVMSGLIGITGMFFFLKWAAVVYFVSTLIAKVGSYLLFRGGDRPRSEKTLAHSVSAAEVLLLYWVFVGPAKGLFQ